MQIQTGIALELDEDDKKTEDTIDRVCKDWEKDWRFTLEKTIADNLYEKDVNNYLFKDEDGKIKVKGAYVTKFSDSNEQDTLAILAQAVVNYFLDGTDIRTTICNPDNPATDYQIIKKLGGMYDTPTWKKDSGDEIVQKVNRIFPSTDTSLGGLYKHKKSKDEGTLDKVEGTPEHVLIYNGDIRDMKIGDLKNIDYEWYVAEARKRIDDFLRCEATSCSKKERRRRMKKDPISEFVKDRNEAIVSMDKKKIYAYCNKYDVKIPKDEKLFWVGIHKAVCSLYFSENSPITLDQYIKSYDYLKSEGFSPLLSGRVTDTYRKGGKN